MTDWQTVATLIAVTLAAGFLCLGGWRTLAGRKSPGCGSGGCAKCPSNSTGSTPSGKPLVTLDAHREKINSG